jgi:glycosyltransferase involved in cell wall biosynthesis
MRYGWVAEAVNRDSETGLQYELFKPWRRYDAVVFLKSMAAGCIHHAQRLRERGVTVIFEANVDYYNEGIEPLPVGHLKSTKEQRRQAVAMTTGSSGVIASSSHLAGICRDMNPRTFWVPDHIPRRMIPRREGREPSMVAPLHIWWSGMPDKTGDLLVAGEALQSMGKRIRLHLVTGDLKSAMRDMDAATTEKLESLLSSVPHTIHRFRTINDLLALYAETRGVIISPRFLDNPYNRSHTEWKITLGMACGLPAIASPQQSYLDVLERAADPSAVTICRNSEEWREALESALEGSRHIVASDSARRTIETHYVSEVVARKHLDAVHSILESR